MPDLERRWMGTPAPPSPPGWGTAHMQTHVTSAEPLRLYLQEARKYDDLTPDQERDLAKR